MVSPLLSEGTDFELECPRIARLLVELPIGLGDGRRPHETCDVEVLHRLVALSFSDSIADPCGIDARVDYEMRDVNILRAEFARDTLSNRTQPEFRGRKRCVSDTAAQAGGRASEENRSAPARGHQASRLPGRHASRIAGH